MLLTLPWIIAALALALLLTCTGLLLWRRRASRPSPLPDEWSLTARPVFSTDERRVYRQLREALPQHIVLSKLPLVRFCQPTEPQRVRYWFDLLDAIHVTFAICSANGRVLAAIDLDTEHAGSSRALKIKQSVLGACRVRYLRCPVDQLPSISELRLLVPHSATTSRAPQSASAETSRDAPPSTGLVRRHERSTLWQDSGFFQDSFFAERRIDSDLGSEFGALGRILRGEADPPETRPPPGMGRHPSGRRHGERTTSQR